jgi:hypothetical protein
MNISEYLEKYKEITLQLIENTKTGEELEELLNERAKMLDVIDDIHFFEDEFKEKVEVMNILQLDNKLQTLIIQEKIKIKNKMDILRKNREARDRYNKLNDNLKIFSAKG